MIDLLKLLLGILASLFRSRADRSGESGSAATDQRASPANTKATRSEQCRSLPVCLPLSLVSVRPGRGRDRQARNTHSLAPCWVSGVLALAIAQPCWKTEGLDRAAHAHWRDEPRTLIGETSRANPLWGTPRDHGELLKLGFDVAQSTVARYMCRRWRPPSQGWRTFLSTHTDGIAAVDLFVLPTIAFQILYCLVVIRHAVGFGYRLA
jgi:hypothetical protein